jgi:hypothetical protein
MEIFFNERMGTTWKSFFQDIIVQPSSLNPGCDCSIQRQKFGGLVDRKLTRVN